MRKLMLLLAMVTLATALRAENPAGKAVDAVKDTAAKAADTTKDTAAKAVDATKDTAAKAVDTTKDAAGKAVDATKDAAGKAGAAVAEGAKAAVAAADRKAGFDAVRESVARHPHAQAAHFAVALGVVAPLFFIAALVWASLLTPARVLLLLASVASGVAAATGGGEAAPYAQGALAEVLKMHQALAVGALAAVVLTTVLAYVESAKKWAWLVALAAAVLTALASMYGSYLMLG